MTTWTPEDLAELTASHSLILSAGDGGHQGVEIGMVVVRGELYVRAFRGARSGWYQAARDHGHGRIRVGDVTLGVLLHSFDPLRLADAIDAAYQAKYGNSSALVTSPAARAATMHIIPALSSDRPGTRRSAAT